MLAELNERALGQLAGDTVDFRAIDTVIPLPDLQPDAAAGAEKRLEGDSFFSDCSASVCLQLKLGAQVTNILSVLSACVSC